MLQIAVLLPYTEFMPLSIMKTKIFQGLFIHIISTTLLVLAL